MFLHLNQFPVALVDLLFIKDRSVLRQLSLPFSELILVFLFCAVCFFTITKVNFENTGLVPYPFLEKVFGKWKMELAFVVLITAFTLLCSVVLHLLATTEIDLIET